MLEGLVQNDYPLTIAHVRDRMAGVFGDSEVVTQLADGRSRASFAEVVQRADRLAAALARLGVGPGDRVATFAWNTQRHFEIYLAVPCMGAVLHTLNIRLFEEQLTYIANHAKDKLVLVEDCLVPVLERVAGTFETVERFIVIGDGDAGSLPNVLRYEELLAQEDGGFEYPELDERQAAGLCYTSGTTGNPKGVLYSHRSNILHSMGAALPDAMGLRAGDRMLPVVPMFHANAWGIPYAAGMLGADLIMPGQFLQAEPISRLLEEEKVTISGAVPTIWMDLLGYVESHPVDLSNLRRIMCGGSAVPLTLMQRWEREHGVQIVQAWGMTETSPLGSVALPPPAASEDEHWELRSRQGRILPLVEARVVGDGGEAQPRDGETTGELEVRGPWIASAYYENAEGDDRFHDGWLRTGDIASIDKHGFIRISDRAKDVIKSGGEWISSVDLEVALMAHPGVAEAAVIAKPDERWQERPLACVVRRAGSEELSAADLAEFLADRVAKWWIPDEYAFVPEIPKTSVGKFDKKVLRVALADGALDDERAVLEKT